MNQSSRQFHKPFIRVVNRVELMDSQRLSRRAVSIAALPKGPVLVVPIDTPLTGLSAHFGVTCIDGCDMLFFDVQAGGKYFCNVASAGDPLVVAALQYCGATGVFPVCLETYEGPFGMARYPFQLNDAYTQALVDGAREDYLSQFQTRFNSILEPGVAEAVVKSRTGLEFPEVVLGFLSSVHTQPAFTPAQ